MDGNTVNVSAQDGGEMYFCIKDYNRAKDLFDSLGEYFKNTQGYKDTKIINGEGTGWMIATVFQGVKQRTVEMYLIDNGYSFNVHF